MLRNGTSLEKGLSLSSSILSSLLCVGDEGSVLADLEVLLCVRCLDLLGSGALPLACLSVLDKPDHRLSTDGVELFIVISLKALVIRGLHSRLH